ncbi:MAG: hypothetical protein A3B44_01330 [Candidatus Levybacteria bacterium RIFCSPLOWO2_01_FULL_38_21]|nr:MAG: hypothetical protein A3B44_01330 [Candidatus Levybacteria bacterium RIFCSPLOWO2_01_FULL_38_21]
MAPQEGPPRNRQDQEGFIFSSECQALAEGMFALRAIRFGDFKWTFHNDYPDVPLAPMYFELRMVRRHLILRNYPVDILQSEARGLTFDMIADVPTAITPTVALLANRLGVGMVSPRKERKGKGSGALVDGFLPEDIGTTVLLIDDVLSRGDSKLILAENLKKEGAIVKDIVVLMDYEIGGRLILERNGYNVHSAFTAKQLLGYLHLSGKISTSKYHKTLQGFLEIRDFFRKVDGNKF